jgi:hypothetical protein
MTCVVDLPRPWKSLRMPLGGHAVPQTLENAPRFPQIHSAYCRGMDR